MTDLITKYQELQIPIFQRLIDTYDFLTEFKIVTDDQYVSIEKYYLLPNNVKFWVEIEIEDVEAFDEIDYYVVRFRHHEIGWYPSNEEEEIEDYSIKSGVFDNIEDVENLIETLNRKDFELANQIMDENNE